MSMNARKRSLLVSLAVAVMLFTGCTRSPQPRFYLLTPLATAQASGGRALSARIGVLPVGIPKYLDRQQIVTKTGPNALVFAEYNRWAEPLADNVRSVLVENLGAEFPSASVTAFPAPRASSCDYLVAVKIKELGAGPDGKAVLRANWGFSRLDGVPLLAREFSATAPAGVSGDHAALAAALSRLMADLSREMAARIGELQLPAGGR